MKIYNVNDREYEAYGRVLTADYQIDTLIQAMEKTPAPNHVIYVPSDAEIEGAFNGLKGVNITLD